MSDQRRLHAIVHGRVQGVSFRYYTTTAAQRLGVSGWVLNHPERTVEVTAEGTQAQLEALLDFLHRGPPEAEVTQVEVEWSAASGEFQGFTVRYRR